MVAVTLNFGFKELHSLLQLGFLEHVLDFGDPQHIIIIYLRKAARLRTLLPGVTDESFVHEMHRLLTVVAMSDTRGAEVHAPVVRGSRRLGNLSMIDACQGVEVWHPSTTIASISGPCVRGEGVV